jgi:membrane protease YdiL (CAAX protease family)
VLGELFVLWVGTLLLIRGVVALQGLGLPEWTLAAVPFLFIYVPVWLCQWRGVDSYAYRLAIPDWREGAAWGQAFLAVGKLVAIILVPWLVGYHLYQTLIFGFSPEWRVPKDAWLLVPYHLFYVAIPEEFFYRGYFQTRLNEVFPRKFLIFGVPIGWGLPIACLFFAFGHSLVQVQWWHFATFFPGLAFGWLRERTSQVAAGALFHAWCNVTVNWLDAIYGVR